MHISIGLQYGQVKFLRQQSKPGETYKRKRSWPNIEAFGVKRMSFSNNFIVVSVNSEVHLVNSEKVLATFLIFGE
jgi:hypothetical protein